MPEDRPTENPRTEALAEFDRRMSFFRSAAEASRLAEDGYLEALATPALRDDSKRQRRWVLLSSVAALLAGLFGMTPTTVNALGLDLSGTKEKIVVLGCGVFTAYFLVEFYTFARRDYLLWRDRVEVGHRRLCAALQREKGQAVVTFGSSSATDEHLRDVESRLARYAKEPDPTRQGWWIVDQAQTLAGWVEVLIPLGFAVVAVILVLVMGLVCALRA